MHSPKSLVFAVGSSAGFSLAALVEVLHRVDWTSVCSLAGSVISTGIGLYIAHRQELSRAALQRQHDERQAARDEKLADLVVEMEIANSRKGGRRRKSEPAQEDLI